MGQYWDCMLCISVYMNVIFDYGLARLGIEMDRVHLSVGEDQSGD